MPLRLHRFLLLPLALLFSGCSAEQSVSIALALTAVFMAPLVATQLVLGGPPFVFGSTIKSGGRHAMAISVFLVTLAGTVILVATATDEMMTLPRASRHNLANEFLLILIPVTIGASLLGSVCDARPANLDFEGLPLPRSRTLTIAWALVVVAMGIGLGVYVLG